MVNNHMTGDISDKLRLGFDQDRLMFLQKKAQQNGFVIISDIDGNVKQVLAKDLLASTPTSQKKGNK